MSRFDRRLKTSGGGGGGSPRPGTATCKIRKKNTAMLSGFIQVNEKNNNESINKDSNSMKLIQEVSSKSLVKDADLIEKTIEKNEKLKKVISVTKDANMKRLLYHELRLNILEVNLDCLTDMKCEEITKDQKDNEGNYNLESINNKVLMYDSSISKINQNNNDIKSSLNVLQNEINITNENISNSFRETNNSLSDRINSIEDVMNKFINKKDESSGSDTRLDYLEQQNNLLKDKLNVYEEKFKLLLEKLSRDDPEYKDMDMY